MWFGLQCRIELRSARLVRFVFDGLVCIDTFRHGGKWLTCLDCETDRIVQASQNAEVREFPCRSIPESLLLTQAGWPCRHFFISRIVCVVRLSVYVWIEIHDTPLCLTSIRCLLAIRWRVQIQ